LTSPAPPLCVAFWASLLRNASPPLLLCRESVHSFSPFYDYVFSSAKALQSFFSGQSPPSSIPPKRWISSKDIFCCLFSSLLGISHKDPCIFLSFFPHLFFTWGRERFYYMGLSLDFFFFSLVINLNDTSGKFWANYPPGNCTLRGTMTSLECCFSP